jgi:hypothetical protein
MSKQQVLKPWTPIKLISLGNKIETHLWGRKYECGDKSFIEKITSQNQELLAEPVRIVGVETVKILYGVIFRISLWMIPMRRQ